MKKFKEIIIADDVEISFGYNTTTCRIIRNKNGNLEIQTDFDIKEHPNGTAFETIGEEIIIFPFDNNPYDHKK